MSHLRAFPLVVLVCAFAHVSDGQAQGSERGVRTRIQACLAQASQGKAKLSRCDDIASRACFDEIDRARGNLSNSAIRVCATRELSAWLQAWADGLEGAQWSADDPRPVLNRFARIQARTARDCLRQPDKLMVEIARCVRGAYGPFLVSEMRRMRESPR